MVDGSRFVERVRRYYRESRPEATKELGSAAEAEAYFQSLAAEIESQVQDAEDQVAGPDLPGETYLEKGGRLTAARGQAEELVLADLLYAIPPEEEDEDDGFSPEAKAWFQEDREMRAHAAALLAEPWPEAPTETQTNG
ncbi:hypothetical protein RHODO2019_19060 (plasmid) [Rhodococcus antarcticus]|uniref:Uncharacterized protein n=1 Tax=Rhodococcus antarcticus TaxID=2987751 RepID=A0ABY6P5W2_9NOCA|nr:hypothetical protein [Rhodococcus antarcticus]UZJ27060.1 hypothetical protein RHODO2019_19060 [Rhodococcus antarcticus]